MLDERLSSESDISRKSFSPPAALASQLRATSAQDFLAAIVTRRICCAHQGLAGAGCPILRAFCKGWELDGEPASHVTIESVFERCTPLARRAVFFARWLANVEGAPAIDTVHLLKGLMWDKDSRAVTILNLREFFPLHYDLPWKYATKQAIPERDLPLDLDSRYALRKATHEADALRDYWIDSEHLLLGILAEKGCDGERCLARTGLTLQRAGQIVIENKLSRPDYGPVPITGTYSRRGTNSCTAGACANTEKQRPNQP